MVLELYGMLNCWPVTMRGLSRIDPAPIARQHNGQRRPIPVQALPQHRLLVLRNLAPKVLLQRRNQLHNRLLRGDLLHQVPLRNQVSLERFARQKVLLEMPITVPSSIVASAMEKVASIRFHSTALPEQCGIKSCKPAIMT